LAQNNNTDKKKDIKPGDHVFVKVGSGLGLGVHAQVGPVMGKCGEMRGEMRGQTGLAPLFSPEGNAGEMRGQTGLAPLFSPDVGTP
jgi:hypothetical protein